MAKVSSRAISQRTHPLSTLAVLCVRPLCCRGTRKSHPRSTDSHCWRGCLECWSHRTPGRVWSPPPGPTEAFLVEPSARQGHVRPNPVHGRRHQDVETQGAGAPGQRRVTRTQGAVVAASCPWTVTRQCVSRTRPAPDSPQDGTGGSPGSMEPDLQGYESKPPGGGHRR